MNHQAFHPRDPFTYQFHVDDLMGGHDVRMQVEYMMKQALTVFPKRAHPGLVMEQLPRDIQTLRLIYRVRYKEPPNHPYNAIEGE